MLPQSETTLVALLGNVPSVHGILSPGSPGSRSEVIGYIHPSQSRKARAGRETRRLAMVEFPALRNWSDRSRRDRIAMDGGAAWQPITGRGTFKEGRTFVLSHPSCRRRSLDGAQSIEGGPEAKNLTGPPALVVRPEDWKWSSYRHYLTGVEGGVEIESESTARRREQMGIRPRLKAGPVQGFPP